MAGLGSILGGALSGFGAGMAKQGEMDFEQRRQMALENMRQQNQQANIRAQGEEQRTTQEAGAKLDDWRDARSNERRTKSTIAINEVQAANERALAAFRSSLEIDQYQSKAATDLANELAAAGKTVGKYEVANDGSIWAYSKTGTVLGKSKPGKFAPPGTSGAAGEGSALSRAGGAPATLPATPGAKVKVEWDK